MVGGLTLAVFLPALLNGFVNFDDMDNFVMNPYYRGLGWDNLRWMFTSAHTGHYIPIAWLTLGLDYVLWEMRPLGYHLTSIVFHAVNAVLFYFLALRLIEQASDPRSSPLEERGDRVAVPLGASAAALLFSVHPLRVESVAWITERRDLVCGLFSLLTVLAYLRAHSLGTQGRLKRRWYWTAVALFILALLAKSIVVGLPLVLLALDLYPLRRMSLANSEGGKQRNRLLVEKLPFFLASAAVSVATIAIGREQGLMTSFGTLGVPERLAVSGYGLIFYLWKTLVPWPLSPLYELHYPVRPLAPGYLLPGVATVAITAVTILARRRWPAGLTTWLIYVTLLLPVIGIIHNGIQIAADRYTYLACLGWALLAGAGVTRCWRAARTGAITPRLWRLVVAVSATVIVALGGLSTLEIRAWRDSETLWRHALALDPRNARAHHNLASALWAVGSTQEAHAEIELALSLLPDQFPKAKAAFHARLGLWLQSEGDIEGAERHYREALSFSRDNFLARYNLGVIYASRGDRLAALESFLHVLRVIPGYQGACANGRRLAGILGVKPKELESCSPRTERHRSAG